MPLLQQKLVDPAAPTLLPAELVPTDDLFSPAVPPPPRDGRAPERFGRYILLEQMGEGGMAEVFRAIVAGAEGFRRQVVLKRILGTHGRSPAFVEMFVREARISAMLHHPNIVQVFDFGEVDGTYFLAMELVDGCELGAVNRALRRTNAKMPIDVAVHIAHQVLLGLSYAHTLEVHGYRPNIVHRDVSPSNIMCLRAGGVKLLDFGVASTAAGRDAAQDGPPSFFGKLAYSAPEYVQTGAQDARIDLFAVGVVLWESLVGERLFRGKSDQATLTALLEKPIEPPSAKRPAVPEEIDRIVLKALERDPARRYSSAAEMAEDLERVLSDRRYQSQSLPRLLNDLFGDTDTHVTAVTAVEELLQSGSSIPPAPPPERSSWAAPRTLKWLRRGTPWAIAGAAILAFTALLSRSHHPGRTPAMLIPRPRVAPLIQPIDHPTPAATQPRRPSHVRESEPGPSAIEQAPARARPIAHRLWGTTTNARPARKRSHKARAVELGGVDLMSNERAVDPFAEAASRRRGR